jgi:hypothetical protein
MEFFIEPPMLKSDVSQHPLPYSAIPLGNSLKRASAGASVERTLNNNIICLQYCNRYGGIGILSASVVFEMLYNVVLLGVSMFVLGFVLNPNYKS